MTTHDINSILMYNEEIYNEIFNAGVLVNATKCCCQQKEFRGEYYGIPQKFIRKISDERNEYLSLLTLLSDKISHIHKLNNCIEDKLTLNKNTDYSSRQITTQRTNN